jgi:HEAT repeat protein
MAPTRQILGIATVAAMIGAGVSAQPVDRAAQAATLVWPDAATGRRLVAEMLAEGAPAIRAVIAALKAPGQGEEAGARATLNAMAFAVNSGADESRRALVSAALIEGLQQPADPEIGAFLIAQIQLVGRDEAVAPLAARLTDARLGEPAVRALRQIGTPAAIAALRQALPAAQGELILHLVNALGSARDAESAAAILPFVGAADSTLRHAALLALADCGSLAAREAILAAATSPAPAERRVGVHAAVILARRLRAAGRPAAAFELRTALGATPAGAYAALATLVDLKGADALPQLIQDAVGADPRRRESALKLTLELLRQPVTAAWCAKLADASPDAREAIVAMLGLRLDASAVPTLRAALQDSEPRVRVAAMEALARFGSETALKPLVAVAAAGAEGDAQAAAGVLSWVGGADFASVVAAALPQATPAGKAILLELLASRQAVAQAPAAVAALADAEAPVRRAALRTLEGIAGAAQVPAVLEFVVKTPEDAERRAAQRVLAAVCRRDPAAAVPVVAALKTASGAARATLLETASKIGGADALAIVVAEVKSTDVALRAAATKSLADWPDASAAEAMLAVAATAADPKAHVLALRGYVRVIGLPADRAPAATAALLGKAWEIAADADERRLVLSGLGAVRDDAALAIIAKALDTEETREEAAAAAVGVCCPRDDQDPGLLTPAAYAAMVKVRDTTKTAAMVARATAHLASFPLGAGANLALGRPVTTTVAQESDKAPERAVNGILTRDDGWWGGASETPKAIQVDLGSAPSIDAVRAIFYWDGTRYYQYTVEGSVDGAAWTALADNSANTTPSTSAGYVHRFKAVEVRYVRLKQIRNSANPSCHLVEFEVYAAGQTPAAFAVAEPAAPPAPPKPAPIVAPPLAAPDADGFSSLFNGTDLTGWMGSTDGYTVADGALVCLEAGGGTLLTMQRFSDFVLQFDFRMPKGANNGLAIRAPAEGNPAYVGMELQIIDNDGYKDVHNYELQPWQVHGSIYGCVPAKTGALKPCGEWNHQEVRAIGSRIAVILNGQTIVDADVEALTATADGAGLDKHPGLKRRTGHIGWLGHGAKVEFKGIRIKPLEPYSAGPHNTPPPGFTALFNGVDLEGWKGLCAVDNPEKRAALPPEELKKLQEEADADMRANWKVEDGALVFSGTGRSLCTAKDYADVEMYVDWKIKDKGDSGIYLRGSPQVQIWDPAQWPQGSGGLYNNQKNPSDPSECADNPIGQWNRFFIRMVGEKVTVVLNGVTVVDNVTLENYWNRALPIFPKGQIELQNHGNTLWFRNLYLRELPAP